MIYVAIVKTKKDVYSILGNAATSLSAAKKAKASFTVPKGDTPLNISIVSFLASDVSITKFDFNDLSVKAELEMPL